MIQTARCGCSGTQPCSCFLEAGAGTVITGSGSAGTPYVISVDGGSTTVLDTPTINMSITGTGTSGNPYVISGAVKLDPAVTNVLTATANGLILTCATIQACIPGGGILTVADTSSIDLTLSPGNILTAVVKLSSTAGNLLTIDGTGLYLSCAQVRTCLSAGNGITYVPATGVVSARLSADAGNTTVFGGDGGIHTPIAVDCGLTGLGTPGSPLEVDTNASVWPFACADTQGAAVYCGVDGALRVDPEKSSIYHTLLIDHGTAQTNAFVVAGTGLTDVGAPVLVVVTNPSTCRSMRLITDAGVEHADLLYQDVGLNDVVIGAHVIVTGSLADNYTSAGHQRWAFRGQAVDDFTRFDTQRSSTRKVYTLAPGAAATFSLTGDMNNFNYNGSALLTSWRTYLDIIGFSL